MQEQFDKRLADKIRDEMEGYTPPFNPAHWADMQKRMGRDTSGVAKKILTSLAIILLVGVAYLPFGNATLENNFNIIHQNNLAESKEASDDIVSEETASIFSTENNGNQSDNNQQKVSNLNNQKQQISESQKQEIDYAQDKSEKVAGNLNLEKETALSDGSSNMLSGTNSSNGFTNQINTAVAVRSKDDKIAENRMTDISAYQYFDDILLLNKPLYLDSIQVATGLVPFENRMAQSQNSLPKFSLSIVAEGFFNQNNRINNYRKPGFGFGALLNFKPGNKFMFSTGLMVEKLSAKTFPNQSEFEESANSLDLEAIPGFSTSSLNNYAASTEEKSELVTITGNFTAVEIPLQFSYYIFNNSKKRFYVSGAISSYFYLSEKYEYEKEKFQLPAFSNIRKLSIVNEEVDYGAFEHVDIFSNITFSAGMERKVGLRSSLSIEPFFRLPIRKMGLENVPVNTTGIRLKYNFGR